MIARLADRGTKVLSTVRPQTNRRNLMQRRRAAEDRSAAKPQPNSTRLTLTQSRKGSQRHSLQDFAFSHFMNFGRKNKKLQVSNEKTFRVMLRGLAPSREP
jgi:hypothetical protein